MRNMLAVTVLLAMATGFAAAPPPASQWTTLGTAAGPRAHALRAQPANLLRSGDQVILVDAGEGVTDELGKVGVQVKDVHTIFISHLHFDHTGGLFGLLGRRYQMRGPGDVTIYGPPGTKATVDGLIAAMNPMTEANKGVLAKFFTAKPADNLKVVEMSEGSKAVIGNVSVTATVNSHYVLSDSEAKEAHSLSFRFDMPDRSIAYTGDTGPSENVERLAKTADLLVSEIMDVDDELAEVKQERPDLGSVQLMVIKRHFTQQHLAPLEVGLMAKRAGARALLVTHVGLKPESIDGAKKAIAANFSGPITFASDLQTY